MDSKRSDNRDGIENRPVRTSDRLRRRPNIMGRSYLYYPTIIRKKNKTKRRTAASQIAKMLRPGHHRTLRSTSNNSVAINLRRSTRKRKISINLENYTTDCSETEDDDLMRPNYHPLKRKIESNISQDDLSIASRHKKIRESIYLPRREGLRPRRSLKDADAQSYHDFDTDQATSEEHVDQDETQNQNDTRGDDADDGEDDREREGEDEGGDDDDEDEQDEGRRRYDLRNRAEVRRYSPSKKEKQLQRSPSRVLHQGTGLKNNRDLRKGSSKIHKRHRLTRFEDSDDSLLVDEVDQGPVAPWARNGSRNGAPWLFGGLENHGVTTWGLNVASSGWGHQGDTFSSLTTGVQTAGPSSKGGADIQPLQIDESVSFDEIGGLSEYINALKEMVFFPLLYPDFFANYHITPPRGVLLCGPPGTGKTLIARALACAASKAGQKVSFYMRKGADVLSKWVGEAERQLKMLFEEAQRNQPSIIFFDEIDGLAPVRSSKQEQIHNSIVSTLLALMDGLDSRGQVVLIGATNRIDAIDGALRRPGRFDREFNFPLPGYKARAEILDIHTRKWKDPPSTDLRMELAASCVGYCGADIKALCTEAAIRAFREKYPQVYTGDDKFLIDVDSVKVEKYHFLEAMSTITPAAHRGSIVQSRPLSLIVAPCLLRHIQKIKDRIANIFHSSASCDISRLSMLSYDSAISLVYKPRLLICGAEGVGLDHVGPAILHELEKFPVHSLSLPSLLSDASAKTPEEALVHIFSEARRMMPSLLYLPQFQLWWETAHEQLKAVLLTLLEELPSDLPILLLGTSSVPFSALDEESSTVFAPRNIYQMDKPTIEDRSLFIGQLVETSLTMPSEEAKKQLKDPSSFPELPKVPKATVGPKISELKAQVETEQHAIRRLRMCLRDVCNRILYDKRFSAFHYPVSDEDAPNYHSVVQNPMDMATLLQHVDSGKFITCASFLRDFDLIVANAKAYNGDDYNGSRIVSRAHELRDAVLGMLSQMDPSLVSFCDKIAAQGGPTPMPDVVSGSTFPPTPVVQLATVTRASARLRNVQPEVSLCQSYDSLKRTKRNADSEQAGLTVPNSSEEKLKSTESEQSKPTTSHPGFSKETELNGQSKRSEDRHLMESETCVTISMESEGDAILSETDISVEVESIKRKLIKMTEGYGVPQLEQLYSNVMKGALKQAVGGSKPAILKYLLKFIEDDESF